MIRISTAVMAVPERHELAEALGHELHAPISYDGAHKGPLWNWRETAKLALADRQATHVCVIQDDVIVCSNLLIALHAAARAQPEAMILPILFPRHKSMLVRARALGTPWVANGARQFGAHAIVLPRAHVEAFLAWTDPLPTRSATIKYPFHDDWMLWYFGRNVRPIRVLRTDPSLVDHRIAGVPSVMGHDRWAWRWVALDFIGSARDALALDWNQPVADFPDVTFKKPPPMLISPVVMAIEERLDRAQALAIKVGIAYVSVTPKVPKGERDDFNAGGHIFGWWTAVQRAREQFPDASHVLLLEDDALVCRDLMAACQKILAVLPTAARVNLYSARGEAQEARDAGETFYRLRDPYNDQGALYSVKYLDLLWKRWTGPEGDAARTDPTLRGADGMRMRLTPGLVWVTAPSLVEHGLPSASTRGHARADRRATWFIGEDVSGLSIDWKQPAQTAVRV